MVAKICDVKIALQQVVTQKKMFSEGSLSDSESSYILSYSVSSSAESFGNNEGITGMYECERVTCSEKKQRKSCFSTVPIA